MERRLIFDEVAQILIETLSCDPEEITPNANFFDDLGGESIDVLDLSFRCEKRFGVRTRFQDLSEAGQAVVGPDGILIESSLQQLRELFPFLSQEQLEGVQGQNARALFTVETIVGFVDHQLAASCPSDHRDR
jgi:acyl carrier protein